MVFWEGGSLWLLATPEGVHYPRTAFHAHHAVQVTLALSGAFALETRDARLGGPAAAVAPDAEHAFEADRMVALLFVEPEGRPGRALMRVLFGGGPLAEVPATLLADLPRRLRAAFDGGVAAEVLVALGREMIAQLAGSSTAARSPDPRVEAMIAWASAGLDDGTLSLADAAELVKLSPGRVRHLFVEETGLPFRHYVLWLRMTKALEAYAAGASLTESAHAAGFSDSAHLSRTCKRMFGIAADSLRLA